MIFRRTTVKMLTAEVEAGLFLHYKTRVVIFQIGGNDCSEKYFDKIAFETDLNIFIDACLTRGVSVVFMSVLHRSKPRYCSPDEYSNRREIVNGIMKQKAVEHSHCLLFQTG